MAFRQRRRIGISRGWAALLILGLALAGGAYWLGPAQAPPVFLELVAVANGQPATQVAVTGTVEPGENVLRFPLQLALRNAGEREVRPQQLVLHVPARYRVATPRGRLPGEVAPGVPLRRYLLDVRGTALEPGAPPQPLPGMETIWLEPDLPRFYCVARTNNVPEFIPAPQYDAQSLADVQIFYSVRAGQQRSTGLLSVQVDPRQLVVQPAEMPPTFPTVFQEPEAEVPELGALQYGGTRTAWCGDPEQPMELYVVQWLTAGGGRFYVIHVGGAPRKHLYDLNGDGIVELETWDVTGDGRFEARRQARFPVPEFLQPIGPLRAELALPDTTPVDSAWLAVFRNTAAGPLRFTRTPQREVTPGAAEGAPEGTPAVAGQPLEPLPPPDSAWLARFLDTRAGPFRFARGTRPAMPEAQPADTPAAVATDTVPTDTVRPPPPPPRRRVPLGTPVEVPPR